MVPVPLGPGYFSLQRAHPGLPLFPLAVSIQFQEEDPPDAQLLRLDNMLLAEGVSGQRREAEEQQQAAQQHQVAVQMTIALSTQTTGPSCPRSDRFTTLS